MVQNMAKQRLHPPKGRQHDVLFLPALGHTVVLGTAGSGKTTLAMHRAVYLANTKLAHGGKTLLLSFNNALLRYFESFEDFVRTNIDVRTAPRFSRGYLNTRGRMSYGTICDAEARLAFIDQATKELQQQLPGNTTLQRPKQFLAEEIKWIAQHGLATEVEYVDAERTGRHGARLVRKERPTVFALYERYRAVRKAGGKEYDWDDLAHTVLEEFQRDKSPRMYRHIVIDEGQDLSPVMIRALAAAIPPDGSLTFFGDMAQQIYGNKISWNSAGLNPPKVWEFSENYRNTQQIAALALAIAEMPYFSGTPDLVKPNKPTADGPLPALVSLRTRAEELAFVAKNANSLGLASSVAVLFRTRDLEATFKPMLSSGAVRLHKDMSQWEHGPGIFYGTYASAKGLEFDAVLLPMIGGDLLPSSEDVQAFGRGEAESVAGKLLYVGVTRAKVTLIMTYVGAPATLLPAGRGLYVERAM